MLSTQQETNVSPFAPPLSVVPGGGAETQKPHRIQGLVQHGHLITGPWGKAGVEISLLLEI